MEGERIVLRRKVFVFGGCENAAKVGVAGTFNNWDPDACRMTRDEKGMFRAKLRLPPGMHQYRFVVDGRWQHDRHASELVRNEHGSWNSVVRV